MNDSSISQRFFLTSWLNSFQEAFIRSLSDLNYYVEVLNVPVRFSFKVLAWFYLMVGLILTIIFALKDLPTLHSNLNEIRSEAVSSYPDTLVFDWKNDELSSNLQQPLEVPFPKVVPRSDSIPTNLLIIDTNTDQFPGTLNTLFFVNKNSIYFNSLQGDWAESKINNIIDEDTAHLDKQQFLKLAEASKTTQADALKLLPLIILFMNTFGLFFVRLLTIAFDALIMQLFFQFLNKPLSYRKVFQLCLHILIPAELIHQFSALVFPSLTFPMFGLAFWLIVILVLWHLRHLRVVNFQITPKQKD